MANENFPRNGVTEATPENTMLGAGTVYIGFEWDGTNIPICATSGGNKVEITQETYDIPADDVGVKMVGLEVKIGEKAIMEINALEIKPETIGSMLISNSATSSNATGYTEVTTKTAIAPGDYKENVAFVGRTVAGKPIVVLFEKARCTSGFNLETKSKESPVPKLTFECYAEIGSNGVDLPWHIYYLTPAA